MSKKLNHIKIKLFFINTKKKTINYKYKLSKNAKIYLKFQILLLDLINLKKLIKKIFCY